MGACEGLQGQLWCVGCGALAMVKIVDVSGWPEDSSGNNQGRGSGNASTGASSGGQFTTGGARAGATGASSSVPLRFSTTATGGTGDSGIQSGLVYVFPPRQDVQQRQQQQRKNRRFDSQEELEQILRRGSRGPRVPPTGSMPGSAEAPTSRPLKDSLAGSIFASSKAVWCLWFYRPDYHCWEW